MDKIIQEEDIEIVSNQIKELEYETEQAKEEYN